MSDSSPQDLSCPGSCAHSLRFHTWVVNGCTSLNVALGVTSLVLSAHGDLKAAAACLVGSVVWDAADGILARRWNVASEFGAQLDSLADMSSFVVAGSALVFHWFVQALPVWVCIPLAIWYALNGAWRLARFNSAPRTPGEFCGLPTTAVAALLAAMIFTCPDFPSWSGAVSVALMASLMTSTLPYPKFTRVTELPKWLFASLPVAACFHLNATVWACSLFYLLSGPFVFVRRRLGSPPPAVAS